MQLRTLPRLEEIANDMGDFFVPSDVKPDEILTRRGRIFNTSRQIAEFAIFATNKTSTMGFNLMSYTKYPKGKWELSISIVNNDEFKEIVEKEMKNA